MYITGYMKRMPKLNRFITLSIFVIVAAASPSFGQNTDHSKVNAHSHAQRYPAILQIPLLSTSMELIMQQAHHPNGRRTTLFLPLPIVKIGHPQDMFL